MKPHRKHLLLATLLAASSTLALAQAPAAGDAPAQPARAERMDPARMQQRMAERHAQRLDKLKAELKLSPAQEGAWNQYTAAMQPPAKGPRMDRAEFDKLTTPQRIDRMQQRSAERQAQMKQRGDAVKTFYAQLTPEQQKVYDERAMRGGRGEGQRGGGRHGHHGMGPGPR